MANPSNAAREPSGSRDRRPHRRRVALLAVGVSVLLAVAARAALPSLVHDYVEAALDENREYDGTLGGVRMRLWRGAYVLEDVELNREAGGQRTPFFAAPRIDLALEWGALLRGRLVGRIRIDRPVLQFVDAGAGGTSGVDRGGAWLDVVERLFPFELDRGEVDGGEVRFRAPYADPPVDLALGKVDIRIDNLTNVHDRLQPHFATVVARGEALGHADVELEMSLDPTSYHPSFDLALRVLGLDVTELNDLARAYANLDFGGGELDLVVELAAHQGAVDGYVKPLFRDLVVFEVADLEEGDPLTVFWNALVGAVTGILENPPADQFGTVVPISGRMDSPDTDLLATVGNVLHNAFVRAFLPTWERQDDGGGLTFGRGGPIEESTR